MKNNRNNCDQQMPFIGFPANMMMFPNYLNDNNINNTFENRLNTLEKKVKVLENRISRLETPYQNNSQNNGYQSTQNNPYNNGEMYMM